MQLLAGAVSRVGGCHWLPAGVASCLVWVVRVEDDPLHLFTTSSPSLDTLWAMLRAHKQVLLLVNQAEKLDSEIEVRPSAMHTYTCIHPFTFCNCVHRHCICIPF